MTAITREYLDECDRNWTGFDYSEGAPLIAALRRVLDLRDDEWRKMRERGAPFFLIPVERLDAALAGTQTDDGATETRAALAAENARLRAQVQAVEALHVREVAQRQVGHGDNAEGVWLCRECLSEFPCRTALATTEAGVAS